MVPKQLLSGIGHHFIMKGRVPTNLILATSDGGLRATTTRERMKILRTTTTQEQLRTSTMPLFLTRIGGSFFNQVFLLVVRPFFLCFSFQKKWFLVAKNLCPCHSLPVFLVWFDGRTVDVCLWTFGVLQKKGGFPEMR